MNDCSPAVSLKWLVRLCFCVQAYLHAVFTAAGSVYSGFTSVASSTNAWRLTTATNVGVSATKKLLSLSVSAASTALSAVPFIGAAGKMITAGIECVHGGDNGVNAGTIIVY